MNDDLKNIVRHHRRLSGLSQAELAKLAGAIPSAVEHANKGVLSKDLNERLKRVEKLSKKLRRELFQ